MRADVSIKVAKFHQKLPKKAAKVVFFQSYIFQNDPKVVIYLGYIVQQFGTKTFQK